MQAAACPNRRVSLTKHWGIQDSADVDLKGLRLERVRDFGDVYLGHYLWWMLRPDKLSGWPGNAPRMLVDELKTIRSAGVALQTRVNGQPGPELVVRCVTQPDKGQEVLLNHLRLEIPNQIKPFQSESRTTSTAAVGQEGRKCSKDYFAKAALALSPGPFLPRNSVTWANRFKLPPTTENPQLSTGMH